MDVCLGSGGEGVEKGIRASSSTGDGIDDARTAKSMSKNIGIYGRKY